MRTTQTEMIVTAWTRSRFDRILSVDDIELVEDFANWAVDLGYFRPHPDAPDFGPNSLSSVES